MEFLVEGTVYTFHMSAAVWCLEQDDYQIVAEFLGWQPMGKEEFLIVMGEESGKTILINPRHLGLVDKLEDEGTDEEPDGIETDDEGTRTITIDAREK